MPNVNYLKSAKEKEKDKQNKRLEENSKQLLGTIGCICKKYDLTDGEFADAVGISRPTFSRRMKKPEDLTAGEIWRMQFRFQEFRFNS